MWADEMTVQAALQWGLKMWLLRLLFSGTEFGFSGYFSVAEVEAVQSALKWSLRVCCLGCSLDFSGAEDVSIQAAIQ